MRGDLEYPSRHDNPFATCWTRAGAIPFRFPIGVGVDQLMARFALKNWRAAIIGPHGSGKSTLLETLKPALVAAGRSVHHVVLRDAQRWLPRHTFELPKRSATSHVLIIDGYEQLCRVQCLYLAWWSRRVRCGLLVTAHEPLSIPTLVNLAPTADLIQQLIADLCRETSALIAKDVVADSHARHGSNVREIFFDLYDRHERSRRSARTADAARAYSNPPH